MQVAHVFQPQKSKYLVFTADYLIPLFISLTLLILGYLCLYSPVFRIQNITCTLDFVDCNYPPVLSELDKIKGQNIFQFKQEQVKSRLLSGDFTIRSIDIVKELPSSIHVDLVSVYPVAAIKVEGESSWIVFDQKYRLIGKRESDPNIPTVTLSESITVTVGKVPTNQSVLATLALAVRLSDEFSGIRFVKLVSPEVIELTLDSGIRAIFSPKKDEDEQLKALQTVLSDDTISKGVKTIDVRFTRPVLR